MRHVLIFALLCSTTAATAQETRPRRPLGQAIQQFAQSPAAQDVVEALGANLKSPIAVREEALSALPPTTPHLPARPNTATPAPAPKSGNLELLKAISDLTQEIVRLREALEHAQATVDEPATPEPGPAVPPEPSPVAPLPPDAVDQAPLPPEPGPPAPAPAPATPTTGPTAPGPSDAPAVLPEQTDTRNAVVWDLLQQRCASCHNGSKGKGGVAFFDADKKTHRPMTSGLLVRMDQKLYAREMPPAPGKAFDDNEYNQFRAWMQGYSDAINAMARESDATR